MGSSVSSLHDGPFCHYVCRASASSGGHPSGRSNRMLRTAKGSLQQYKNKADIAQEALNSFLGNNSTPLMDNLEGGYFDSNKTMLERELAKALRDVAKEQLRRLKGKNAQGLQLAEADR